MPPSGGAVRLPPPLSSSLDAVLREVDLPAEAKAAFHKAKIVTVAQLAQYSPEALRKELAPH
eukprot:6478951-Prymnesium_polylepis.1